MNIRAALHGAVAFLLSMSAAGQGPVVGDQMISITGAHTGPTQVIVVPYADDWHTVVPDAPPSCYRIGRCSAYDLYRFRDRPNRLTRLAPEPPAESGPPPASIHYMWILVPVTPEENIVPKYRTASQVRDEYRAAGSSIGGRN